MGSAVGIIRGPRVTMAFSFEDEMAGELAGIDSANLRRAVREMGSPQGPRVRLEGREVLNFSANDYLGLANHPALKEAATAAIGKFGAGAGAARLISGSQSPHHELENALAMFKGTEAALTFSSGYASALGTIPALVGQGDVVVLDKLVHASLVDAAKLSGAKLRVCKHNDLADLARLLEWAAGRGGRTLVVAESVYSMDGDLAPLLNLVELKEQHGAWLMLDEAHATGLYGEGRRGVAEEFGVAHRVEVQMGTLGKALGASGGYICGSNELIDLLRHRARSFVFSTAPMPAQAAAARAGIEVVESAEGEERRTRLWSLVDQLKNGLIARGWKLPVVQSAILPLRLGAEADAVVLSERLLEAGVFVPAIRYPTVARGEARLRITVSAAHSADDIKKLLETLGEEKGDA
ncbi:MAG: 8-amino-7-oxononanoate synthase [Verrucomicrobiia bacterium]|mgnify:CR=1 FL=1|jgi:8-amino-7-oxononanoate synthase|tara:strand:- start:315 stop:1538 length:1224 start_codon:yes stop_codon:yes gene_type:complete